MADPYLPPSHFLRAAIEQIVPFAGSAFAEANLARLIAKTRDPEPANRDWATTLLAGLAIDRADAREALLASAQDADAAVRAEAIRGLARLDPALALPLLRRELAGDEVTVPLLEAAALAADPSLLALLRPFRAAVGDAWLAGLLEKAIEATIDALPGSA